MILKELPIGVQTFASLITSNAMYVDKTEFLYRLISGTTAKRYFLSRPRRFGKSLTCSTLATIFEGHKELFKDLWIGQSDYAWEKHPIVYFDFNGISHQTPAMLIRGLHGKLDDHAEHYNITLSKTDLKEKFAELIKKLAAAHGPVCVIIDEYDKPIIDLIEDLQEAKQSQRELKNFYGTMKDKDVDACLHFLFVTGVSKFSKVSLFSDFNNLNDITMDSRYAALVGYTDEDVDTYLTDHITAFAKERGEPFAETRKTLKTWYNGYCFTEKNLTVYNPLSLHKCLTERRLSEYWFATGTPNFLMHWIKYNPPIADQIETIEGEKIASSEMDAFSIDMYGQKFKVLLLQTGYLTVTGYDAKRRSYSVAYPNEEVRYAMTSQIMEFVGQVTPVKFGDFISKFSDALAADDMGLFCQHLQDFFTLIPHTIIVDREKFYQGTFYMICRLFNGQLLAEVPTHMGFIDIQLDGTKHRHIIEMKKDRSPNIALKQIEGKGYHLASKIESKKPIKLVGISFHKTAKGVNVKWKAKNVNPAKR